MEGRPGGAGVHGAPSRPTEVGQVVLSGDSTEGKRFGQPVSERVEFGLETGALATLVPRAGRGMELPDLSC